MNLYPLVLFLHVLGAVGLFASNALEAACVALARRAGSAAEARAPLQLLVVPGRLAPAAMLTTLGSGAWMMATVWGKQGWTGAGIVGLVAMGMAGMLSMRRLRPARRALAPGAAAGMPVPAAVGDPVVLVSLWLRAAIGVAMLVLMTVRPQGAGAWSVLAMSVVVGMVGSLWGLSVRSRVVRLGPQPELAPASVAHRAREEP